MTYHINQFRKRKKTMENFSQLLKFGCMRRSLPFDTRKSHRTLHFVIVLSLKQTFEIGTQIV